MTPEQREALEHLVGRQLTAPEVTAIELADVLPIRNEVAIAAILSAGRTRLQSKLIGFGTIIAEMGMTGVSGGVFIDQLKILGETDRDVYWIRYNMERGALDLGEPATQAKVSALKPDYPSYAAGLDRLLALGWVPDPIHFNAVSDVLNVAEGRMSV